MPLDLQGGFGLGGMEEALQQLTKQRFLEDQARIQHEEELARQAENTRQFDTGLAAKTREAELGRGHDVDLLGRRQTFEGGQAELGRTHDINLLDLRHAFQSGEAEKGRGFDRQLFDLKNAFTAEQNALGRQHETGIEQMRGESDLANIRLGSQLRPQAQLTPNQEMLAINRLKTDWDKGTENYRELKQQAANMATGMAAARRGDTAAGAQAVLVTFQKILDPTSVVRESEYARSGAGQSLLNRIEGSIERLAQGGAGVPVAELEAFSRMADEFVKNAESGLTGRRARLERQAAEYGLKSDLIFDSDIGRPQPQTGGRVRVQGPNGETGTIDAAEAATLPAGWKVVGR